jgi:hypothetical protein
MPLSDVVQPVAERFVGGLNPGENPGFSDSETVFILSAETASHGRFVLRRARFDGVELFPQANFTRGTTGIISGEKPLAWH